MTLAKQRTLRDYCPPGSHWITDRRPVMRHVSSHVSHDTQPIHALVYADIPTVQVVAVISPDTQQVARMPLLERAVHS